MKRRDLLKKLWIAPAVVVAAKVIEKIETQVAAKPAYPCEVIGRATCR